MKTSITYNARRHGLKRADSGSNPYTDIEESWMLLAVAILECAVKDYARCGVRSDHATSLAVEKRRNSAIKFFESDWCDMLITSGRCTGREIMEAIDKNGWEATRYYDRVNALR